MKRGTQKAMKKRLGKVGMNEKEKLAKIRMVGNERKWLENKIKRRITNTQNGKRKALKSVPGGSDLWSAHPGESTAPLSSSPHQLRFTDHFNLF